MIVLPDIEFTLLTELLLSLLSVSSSNSSNAMSSKLRSFPRRQFADGIDILEEVTAGSEAGVEWTIG